MKENMTNEEVVSSRIEEFSKIQREGHFPCPRCGRYRMDSDPIRNALSRHADVQVCNQCGTEEAVADFIHSPMPLTEWAISLNPGRYLREER